MNPGPVVADPRVRQALADVELCHREPEFAGMSQRVRGMIAEVAGAGTSHAAVLLTTSGTGALEAVLSSVVPPGGKLLVVANGYYGERLAEIARVHALDVEVVDFGWTSPVDVERVAAALRAGDVTHVGLVHHETSTGMLNPVTELARVVREAGASLVLDAISSIGGEPLDVVADGVDWCVGTANKCIEGIPGISFVLAPHERWHGLAGNPPRTVYLDLHRHYQTQVVDGSPAFTPAVQVVHALERALELLLEETVTRRSARYRSSSETLRSGLEELGLDLLLAPADRSSTLTAIGQPDGIDYATLHARMKAEGFVIYAGQRELSDRAFRLATMGQLTVDDIARFLTELRLALAGERIGRGSEQRA